MRLRYGVGVPLLPMAAVGAGLGTAVAVGSATATPQVFLGAGHWPPASWAAWGHKSWRAAAPAAFVPGSRSC